MEEIEACPSRRGASPVFLLRNCWKNGFWHLLFDMKMCVMGSLSKAIILLLLFTSHFCVAHPPGDSLSKQVDLGWKLLDELKPHKSRELGTQLQETYEMEGLKDENLQGEIYHLLGAAFLQMNQREEAQPYLKASLGIHPQNAAAWSDWAELSYREGKYQDALDRVAEGLKHTDNLPRLRRSLLLQQAQIGIQTGLLTEAEEALAQLDLKPRDYLPYLKKVFLETEMDKIYGRIRSLREAPSEVLPYSKAETEGFSPVETYYYTLLKTIWMTNLGMPLKQYKNLDSIRNVVTAPWFPPELEAHFWERLVQYGIGFLPSDSISYFNEKAEAAYNKAFVEGHLIRLEMAMRNAFFLWELGKYAELIRLMERYEEIIDAAGITNHNALPYIWRLQALAHRRTGNLDKALFLLEKAILTLQEQFPKGHWEIAGFLNSLGNTYSSIKEEEALKKAIQTYQKVIDIYEKQFGKDDIETAGTYHNMGMAYLSMDKTEQGLANLEKAFQITKKGYGPDHLNAARHAYMLGEAYLASGNVKKAIEMGRFGYQIYLRKTQPSENYRVANAIYLSQSFIEAGLYDSAFHYIGLAFDGYFPEFDMEEVEKLTQPEHFVLYDLENATALFGTLGDIYQKTGQHEKARTAYKVSILWRDQYEIRASHGNTGYTRDPSFLIDYANFATNNEVLFQQTGNPLYLEESFAVIDKSKTNTLRYQLQGNRAVKYAGVPDQVLQEGKKLYEVYEEAEREFLQMKIIGASKEDLLAQEISLKEHKQSYYDWEKKLERSYPRYFQLKYDQHLVFPDEVRDKLNHEETLVLEYFWFENSMLFIYAFDKEKIIQIRDSINGNFEALLDSLNDMLSLPVYAENKSFDPDFFKGFTSISHDLYQKLIGNALDKMGRKNYKRLLIIPDKKLSRLNFDILLTKKQEYDHVSYQDLPYLIRDYQIRYEYAASLLEEARPQTELPPYPYLGMAPLFASDYRRRLTTQKDLDFFDSRLKYNQKEVSKAHNLLGGQVFKGKQAVEKRAKEYLENASILHFATHTLMNDSFPMYTSLVLHEGEDSLEDGFLHAYEIYPRDLKAELTVLSACETGLGKWKHGEGMMSLARAFKYAGCSNIVMSLWQADDQASSEVIAQFFTYLKQGYPKDEALRLAKLKFLEQGNGKQFPHYWATFVLVGDDEGVQFRQSPLRGNTWKILLAGLLILALGLWMLRRNLLSR